DVHMAWAVLVDLDGEERLLDAERGEQLLRPLVGLAPERRLLHPAEDDPAGRPIELQRDQSVPRLEVHLVPFEVLTDEEGRPEDRVPRERQLRHGREDPHARVAAILGREQEHRFREIELAPDPLHLLAGERLPVREHAELVALERRVGEDVDDVVGVELACERDLVHAHALWAIAVTSISISLRSGAPTVVRTGRGSLAKTRSQTAL